MANIFKKVTFLITLQQEWFLALQQEWLLSQGDIS